MVSSHSAGKGFATWNYRVEIIRLQTRRDLSVQCDLLLVSRASPSTAAERIPPDYNTESKHTVEVSASGKNHFVFDVKSKKSK